MKLVPSAVPSRAWLKPLAAAFALSLVLAACSIKEGEGGSSPSSVTPGATFEAAAAASMGMTVSAEITEQEPDHFYRFDNPGKLRDIVKVRLENKSSTLYPEVKIYNSERSRIAGKYDNTPGAHIEQTVVVEAGKAIYVEVMPWTKSAGAYELSVVPTKAYDAYEANDDQMTATTLNFGTAVEANIMDPEDRDWYHVTPATSGKISIGFENLSSGLYPDVRVYSANKSQVAGKYDATPGAGMDFNVDVQQGQDFYIQVQRWSSSHGKYRLSTRPAVLASDMAGALGAKGSIDLYGVYFDTDKTFVKPESANTLTEVANLLKADPTLRLEVAGHTDSAGTKEHNQTLSQGRADAVVQALAGQYGIDPSRLVAKGHGDTKPVAPNDNPANMARNRRVELKKL